MFKKIIAFFMAFFLAVSAFFSGLFQKKPAPEPFDLAYGSAERQVLDIELPDKQGAVSLVLFIHGGGWIAGSKELYRENLQLWAKNGYAAAAINYRYLSDTVKMTDLLDDIDAALAAIKSYAADRGQTIRKALLTGASAGGHLSLLYAYARKDTAPITPACVVSYCGVMDLASPQFIEENGLGDLGVMVDWMRKASGVALTKAEYEAKSGNYDAYMAALREISPLTYASSAVPTVIAHGEEDNVAPFADAVRMDAALTDAGVPHEFIVYPHSGHGLEDADSGVRTNEAFVQYALTYLK
ncbi:MAG: alpha/beta hydrolase [Clostridia bacterium]|nr:alpha/beta hydrolase [Clostridia bacterium]